MQFQLKVLRLPIIAITLFLSSCAQGNVPSDTELASQHIDSIMGICEDKGLVACSASLKGIDPLISYLQLCDEVKSIESRFLVFVKDRYQDENSYPLVSLPLCSEVRFTRDAFTKRITSVKKVPGGFDVTLDGNLVYLLRSDNEDHWTISFPEQMVSQLSQLTNHRVAIETKRSILVYRMLEADMADLSAEELKAGIDHDFYPLVVAVMGSRFPMPILSNIQPVEKVIEFYTQFESVDDMKAHIRKAHNL